MMMKRKMILVFLLVCAVILGITGCLNKADDAYIIKTFRDIPRVTGEEIAAIEALQEKHEFFTYGMFLSTEAFIKDNGETGGYAALFCDWLTELFDIKFIVEFGNSSEVQDNLRSGAIDFSGNIMLTEDNKKIFHMSDTITERQ